MNNRISGESSKLITSLDADSRYIKFVALDDFYSAVICSSLTDDELSSVFSGDNHLWTFLDRSKAVRSIRRLNKEISIYQGVFSSDSKSS